MWELKLLKGILPLWKPKGMTSHDCVMKIRKIYGLRKVGHTGTLDPEVEGVLPICLGQATKLVPYLTALKKTYVAELTLGVATETEDSHGEIICKKEVLHSPTKEKIDEVLQSFEGNITQIPPMYSAVRVKGKRLYEYARENKTVERPVRHVTIYEIKRLDMEMEKANTFKIEVVCSQGTYIRTLCVDIGKKLGYPAHMSHLIRTESGSFKSEDAFQFEDIERAKAKKIERDLLLPMIDGLRHLDSINVDEDKKNQILHGQKFPKPCKKLTTDPFTMIYKGEVIAIYKVHPKNTDMIKPVRVFNR